MIKNVGKAYCIRNYTELNVCHFFKDRTYEVIELNDFTIAIIGENDRRLKFNKWSPFNEFTIPSHFVPLKEYRKLKLQNILNVKSSKS